MFERLSQGQFIIGDYLVKRTTVTLDNTKAYDKLALLFEKQTSLNNVY